MRVNDLQKKLTKHTEKLTNIVNVSMTDEELVPMYSQRLILNDTIRKVEQAITGITYDDLKPDDMPEIERVNRGIKIDGIEINEDRYDEVGYQLIERKEKITDLMGYLCEAGESNSDLIRDDVDMLIESDDEWLLSDLGTNSYILPSNERKIFIEVCHKLINA